MIFPDTVIQDRKNSIAKALNPILSSDDVVLVHAGLPLQKPGGLDQTYPFLPHPDYFWLTGHRRAGGVSAYSKSEGWIDFVEPVNRDEKVWEGGGETLPGKDLKSFQNWLTSKKFNRIFTLGQHQDSISVDPSRDTDRVLEFYNEVRRVKDAHEIELIKKIAGISHKGYEAIQHFIKPGVSEKEIQIEYESTVLRYGSEKLPYGTIVGTGSNAAILHASPSARIVQKGEMVLIDAGADIEDYCVDITRVFPADGTFSDQQKMIYETVLKAQEASIELCRPGVEWKDVHIASARVIAEGLKDMGILKCSVEESLETAAVSLFFPHGVGHMVGLRVRDVGGKFNPNPRKYAGARLRVDMPLKEGYLMTVEPGLYFIEALLNDEETRTLYKSQVNWDELKHWKEIGGVRLEDDIHVTAQGPINLTSIVPK